MKFRASEYGFSLIEIMVVLAIMGILVSIIGVNVMGMHYKAQVSKVRADFSKMEGALKMYKLENGMYPSTEQGIEALVYKTEIHPIPRDFPKEGYLDRMPKDPWKNNYVYLSPGANHHYEIQSFGADGIEGGEDESVDLDVWHEVN